MRVFQTLPAGRIGQDGAPGRDGDASTRPVGWLAALSGSCPCADLRAVTVSVVVGVGPGGVRAAGLLVEVGEPVAVAILARVGDAIAVGVRHAGMEDRPELAPVPQAVGVGVLAIVARPIPVGVRGSGPRPARLLLQVRQTVRVEILGAIHDPIAVGVPSRWAGLRPFPLVGVRQPVAVRVRGGCRGRSGAPRSRRHDERRQGDQAVGEAGPRHLLRVGHEAYRGPSSKVPIGPDDRPVPGRTVASRGTTRGRPPPASPSRPR